MKVWMPLVLCALVIAACGTPEIARDYESRAFLPEEIGEALRSEDVARRADAASQVEAMDPPARRAALLGLLDDERASIRLMAVGILAKHHASEPAVVERLGQTLSLDSDPDVRGAIVDALAASGRPKAFDALVAALADDPSLLAKCRVAAALDRISGTTLGAELVERASGAEEAADEAMMAYDEWLENHRGSLHWDAALGQFVPKGASR